MKRLAKKPARSSDKVTLHFGLVPIPVSVYNALDEDNGKIHRSRFSAAGNRLKQLLVDTETGEEVEVKDCVMRYETESGMLVALSDDEIAAAVGVENGDAETLGTIPLTALSSPALIAGTFMVRPQTVTQGPKTTSPFDYPFALFLAALKAEQKALVFRYVSRGNVKVLALGGNGYAVQLRSALMLREELPLATPEPSKEHLAAARKVINSLLLDADEALPEGSEITAIREYAESKAAEGEELVLPSPSATAPISGEDLTSLLSASLNS